MIKNSALPAMREENVGPFTRGNLHLILDQREGEQKVCVCFLSQLCSAQNNPNPRVTHFGMTYSDPLHSH